MMKKTKRFSLGFTLLELLITLVIMGIVLAGALPSLTESIRNNMVSSQNLSLLSMLNFARSEAIRRNTEVVIELNASGNSWGVIVQDPNNEADIEGCVPGQLRCASHNDVSLSTASTTLTFNNRGYIRGADDTWESETLFMQHAHCNGQNQRRRIDITPTGQVSSCALACDSEAVCP